MPSKLPNHDSNSLFGWLPSRIAYNRPIDGRNSDRIETPALLLQGCDLLVCEA
jgi:hypothetical protein